MSYRPGAPEERPRMRTPKNLLAVLAPLPVRHDRERAVLVGLDAGHRLIDVGIISEGTAGETFMGGREIYREALVLGASAIVLAHNHPSGDPQRSMADRAVTRHLKVAGKTLRIGLLDHLVIGSETEWVSMAQEGLV